MFQLLLWLTYVVAYVVLSCCIAYAIRTVRRYTAIRLCYFPALLIYLAAGRDRGRQIDNSHGGHRASDDHRKIHESRHLNRIHQHR